MTKLNNLIPDVKAPSKVEVYLHGSQESGLVIALFGAFYK
jgi:hypothetical protein